MVLIHKKTLTPWNGEVIDGLRHQPNIGEVWSEKELNDVGLAKPIAFVPPVGKEKVGLVSYTIKDGLVYEQFAVQDITIAPELTPEEKLFSSTGLTITDLRKLLDIS